MRQELTDFELLELKLKYAAKSNYCNDNLESAKHKVYEQQETNELTQLAPENIYRVICEDTADIKNVTCYP